MTKEITLENITKSEIKNLYDCYMILLRLRPKYYTTLYPELKKAIKNVPGKEFKDINPKSWNYETPDFRISMLDVVKKYKNELPIHFNYVCSLMKIISEITDPKIKKNYPEFFENLLD